MKSKSATGFTHFH